MQTASRGSPGTLNFLLSKDLSEIQMGSPPTGYRICVGLNSATVDNNHLETVQDRHPFFL